MSQQPLIGDEPGINIRFHGSGENIILRPYSYGRGVDANSFRALPPDRFVTAVPRIHHKKVPFERYSTWCTDWCTPSSLVFYTETFPTDRAAMRLRFAIKVALQTHVNNSWGSRHLDSLLDEAMFYKEHLNELQGRAVPKHYGIWVGSTSWGGTIACAILEWAGMPYSIDEFDKDLERKDRRVKVMAVLTALHRAGLQHNAVGSENSGHILFDESREKAFVVDFKHAQEHHCRLNMKLKPYRTPPAPHILGCEELYEVGRTIQFFGIGPSFGPGADPEVQKATQKVQDAYYKRKQVQEARARLDAYLEQHGRTVARAPAKRYLSTTVQTEDDARG
ncbi:hypothetical protein EV714DRAFT_269917 [Schizophyllum commune]